MNSILWIGFGFLVLLVGFLITSFFATPKLTNDQRGTLKLLSALCAAFSGGFITGGAIVEMHKTTGATTFAISGTAGFALFIIVWFFYPKVFKLDDGFDFSIPPNWTFRDTVDAMTRTTNGTAEFKGFTSQELSAPMQSRRLSSRSLGDAIIQLRSTTATADAIRRYDVAQDGSVYRLTVR